MINPTLPTMEFLSNSNNFNIESTDIKTTLLNLEKLHHGFFQIRMRADKLRVTIETLEREYENIFSLFQKAIEGIGTIKKQIHQKINHENSYEELIRQTTRVEDLLEDVLKETNDALLTFRPTAKIPYGNRCIEDVITTSNETKIQELLKTHAGLRKVRGDGNCFLSSFITRLLESYAHNNKLGDLVELVKNDKLETSLLVKTECFENMLPLLKKEVSEIFESIQKKPAEIKEILADNKKILPLIKYFRILAADEMITKEDQFGFGLRSDVEDIFNKIQKGKSHQDLISEYILKMGIDFSQPGIVALCQRLNFCVKIIDPKIGDLKGVIILDNQKPEATFCRDGAHYFVLYTQDEIEQIKSNVITPISMNNNYAQEEWLAIECKQTLPFGCSLFVRGSGNELSWDKGTGLINIGNDVWVFKSSKPIEKGECKFLLNDDINYWENSKNRKITNGKLVDALPAQFKNLPNYYENIEVSIKLNFDENKYSLAICGCGIDGVGDWDSTNPIYLSKENGIWSTQIQQKENSKPILFKYVLIEKEANKEPIWEKTPDRKIGDNHIPVFN